MLQNYLKIALKVLLRRKFFTFISLFGISFTLLILLVVTSLVDHTFGPHAPETNLDRTLSATFFDVRGEHNHMGGAVMSYYFFDRYIKTLKTPEKVSIFSIYSTVVTYHHGRKFDFFVKYTDSEYWDILDFTFIEGQPYTQNDVENTNYVAVINRETRDNYFNGESALKKQIEIGGKYFTVIGVVENVTALRLYPYSDIWMPVTTSKEDIDKVSLTASGGPGYGSLILAHDPSDFPLIKEELQNHLAQVEFPDPAYNSITGHADTYLETISRVMFMDQDKSNTTGVYLVVILLIFLFMLLPAINLVNINITRIMERASEIGIRKSFGASSFKLINQFVIENIVLTLIGGMISFILANIVLNIINESAIIVHVHLGFNWRIFIIGLFMILFFSLISGIYPAIKMARLNPVNALRGGQQ